MLLFYIPPAHDWPYEVIQQRCGHWLTLCWRFTI